MKSIIQKGKYQREPNPKTRHFQTSRPCEVQRSDQATTFVVCAVFLLSFQAVVLPTKTAINHLFFFKICSEVSGWI